MGDEQIDYQPIIGWKNLPYGDEVAQFIQISLRLLDRDSRCGEVGN